MSHAFRLPVARPPAALPGAIAPWATPLDTASAPTLAYAHPDPEIRAIWETDPERPAFCCMIRRSLDELQAVEGLTPLAALVIVSPHFHPASPALEAMADGGAALARAAGPLMQDLPTMWYGRCVAPEARENTMTPEARGNCTTPEARGARPGPERSEARPVLMINEMVVRGLAGDGVTLASTLVHEMAHARQMRHAGHMLPAGLPEAGVLPARFVQLAWAEAGATMREVRWIRAVHLPDVPQATIGAALTDCTTQMQAALSARDPGEKAAARDRATLALAVAAGTACGALAGLPQTLASNLRESLSAMAPAGFAALCDRLAPLLCTGDTPPWRDQPAPWTEAGRALDAFWTAARADRLRG